MDSSFEVLEIPCVKASKVVLGKILDLISLKE